MPPLPPCINLSGEQYVYLENKFQYTGTTTEPNTICSYVLNATGEKVPHVDLSGEMMQVPNNVPSMLPQFEQVICMKCKKPKKMVMKRNARQTTIALISQTKHRSKKSILARYLVAISTTIAKDQIKSFKYATYADMDTTIDGFKRHFARYIKRCRSKNRFEVGRELLYQFMEHNSVLLPMSATEYIANTWKSDPECAHLFTPGWLSPK
jgi:hypothetical protein